MFAKAYITTLILSTLALYYWSVHPDRRFQQESSPIASKSTGRMPASDPSDKICFEHLADIYRTDSPSLLKTTANIQKSWQEFNQDQMKNWWGKYRSYINNLNKVLDEDLSQDDLKNITAAKGWWLFTKTLMTPKGRYLPNKSELKLLSENAKARKIYDILLGINDVMGHLSYMTFRPIEWILQSPSSLMVNRKLSFAQDLAFTTHRSLYETTRFLAPWYLIDGVSFVAKNFPGMNLIYSGLANVGTYTQTAAGAINRNLVNADWNRGLAQSKFYQRYKRSSVYQFINTNLVHLVDPVGQGQQHIEYRKILKTFELQFVSPDKTLSPPEKKLFEKYGLLKAYYERTNFLKKNKGMHRFQMAKQMLIEAGQLASMAYIVNMLVQMQEEERYLSATKYLENNQLPEDEIQIIIDEAPIPHLAVRIKNDVYTYGYYQLRKVSLTEYFHVKTNQDFQRTRGYDPASWKVFKRLFPFLESMPHSSLVYNLKVDKNSRNQLIRDFEENLNKDYRNITFVNDCATMMVRAINKNTSYQLPYFIDSSPNQLGLYLSSMVGKDDSAVTQFYQVASQKSEFREFHTYRNAYVAYLESKIFVRFFAVFRGARFAMDSTIQPEQLQWWHPNHYKKMERWQKEVEEKFQKNGSLLRYRSAMLALTNFKNKKDSGQFDENDVRLLKKFVDDYFEYEYPGIKKKAEKTVADLQAQQKDLFQSRYLLEYLPLANQQLRDLYSQVENP